jgi:hypothetical protein
VTALDDAMNSDGKWKWRTWVSADVDEIWKDVPADDVGNVMERASIMEYDGKFTRNQSDRMALASYFGYAWAKIFETMRIR